MALDVGATAVEELGPYKSEEPEELVEVELVELVLVAVLLLEVAGPYKLASELFAEVDGPYKSSDDFFATAGFLAGVEAFLDGVESPYKSVELDEPEELVESPYMSVDPEALELEVSSSAANE